MADNIRVLVTGGVPSDNRDLQRELTALDLSATVCENDAVLAAALKESGKARIVVCSCQPSITHALSLAQELKRGRPYLPVVIHDQEVREVTRLKCIEQGLDEFVSRTEVARAVAGMAALLALRSTDATLEDVKSSSESRQGEMYFQLNGDELSNAIQFLCMTSRKGRLSLKFDSGSSGVIYLDNGTLSHAKYEEYEDLEALARILSGGAMEARFFEGREPPAVTNKKVISQVLIEASVLADEL